MRTEDIFQYEIEKHKTDSKWRKMLKKILILIVYSIFSIILIIFAWFIIINIDI